MTKSFVTVKQLFATTSGLAGDDSSLGGDDKISDRMLRSRDWICHILGRRLGNNPDERFANSDATSHLLSAVVADATGQSTLAFARAGSFGPLGIATDHALELTVNHWPLTQAELETFEQATLAWPRDPQGYHIGGGGLKLPARDLAKLGYLYPTAGSGTASRWFLLNTFVPPHSHKATQVRAITATSGGSPTITATTPSAPRATAASSSTSSPSWTSAPVAIASDPDQERNDAGNLVWATIVPAVTG